ncbi:MAG: flippase-like domain-containing protein [Myxococcales bacterium]|nr:flippase-like domain-containing protein [Myxococcales bacterium]
MRLLLSLGIGALFIWFVVAKFDFGAVFSLSYAYRLDGATLSVLKPTGGIAWSLDLVTLLPVIAIVVLIHFIKVWRWELMLKPLGRFGFSEVNAVSAVGFMSILLFPLRLGEFVRPYLIAARNPKTSMSEVMATIVVERVVDGLTTAFFLVGALYFLPKGAGREFALLETGSYIALAIFSALVLMILLAWWRIELVCRILDLTVGLVSQKLAAFAKQVLRAFFDGLAKLPDVGMIVGFIVWTALYWGVNGVAIWWLAKGFGVELSLFGGYVLMCTLVIGIMIPGPPGQAGNFEAAILLPLALFSPNTPVANGAFTLMLHAIFLIQPTLFGLYFIVRGKIRMRRVWESTKSDGGAPPGATIGDPGAYSGTKQPVVGE